MRILDGHDGTAARTRVHVEMGDGQTIWSTTGVDLNIIAATLNAIIESYEYGLLLRRSAGLLQAGSLRVAPPGPDVRCGVQVHGAGAGPAGNVGVQPRGEHRLPILILNEVDPGRSEIGA